MITISKTALLGLLISIFSIVPLFSQAQSVKAAEISGIFIDTAFAKDDKATTIDLEARRKILDKVSQNTQSEISGLKDKLNSLDLSDDWSKIRDAFISDLSNFESYNQSFDDKINDKKITLNDIKNLAKELKDWRETTYTPELKEISNMTFIFDEENLLKIAHDRLDKISADIKKFDSQGIIKTNVLKTLFAQAQKRLSNADDFKNEAKDLFFKSISNSDDSDIDLQENSTSTQQEATSTDINQTQATTTQKQISDVTKIEKTPAEIQNSIQDLLKKSIIEVKATYDIFFKMNTEIRKYL